VTPLIAVFVGNVPARGPQYTQVLVEEIVPYVDRSFRTTASAAGRANVGANFGALAALSASFGHPEMFGKVGVQSAALFDFARVPLEAQIRTAAEAPLDIYIDWGKYDLRNSRENWDLGVLNRQLYELLEARGYSPAGGETHDGAGWPAWRNRTGELLSSLFPKH
jgi:enterochelin esterase-like enzyme